MLRYYCFQKALSWLWLLAILSVYLCVSHPAEAESEFKAGDTISVVVFDEGSISGAFSVSTQGTINYPLLGKLDVSGKTSDEVADLIEAKLEQDYIRDAQVTVDLTKRTPDTVAVIGYVLQPGRIMVPPDGNLDLFTAVASAGGFAPNANTARLEVKRRAGDSLETLYVDLGADKDFGLQPEDTIIVGGIETEQNFVTILGEVGTEGLVEFPQSGRMTLVEAIAHAGGATELANSRKVSVTRGDDTFILNFSRMQRGEAEAFPLSPGDNVYVPESFF